MLPSTNFSRHNACYRKLFEETVGMIAEGNRDVDGRGGALRTVVPFQPSKQLRQNSKTGPLTITIRFYIIILAEYVAISYRNRTQGSPTLFSAVINIGVIRHCGGCILCQKKYLTKLSSGDIAKERRCLYIELTTKN